MDYSRRRFLVQAMGAAAAVGGAPSLILQRANARGIRLAAPSERITLGLIGMGIQNRFHLQAFLKRPDTHVLAVCDVDTTRREHAKALADKAYESDDCAAYNDYRELLARPDIDAVVISTPDHWHAIQVIDACRAGKDVYCEKPLTLTLFEARLCMEAVRAHRRVFQTGSQQRSEFGGRFRTACELVRNRRLGDIVTVSVGIHAYKGSPTAHFCDLGEEPIEPGLDWDRWLGPAPMRPYHSVLSPRGVNNFYPDWRIYREYSGGMITDWGAHMFDIAQWGLNMDQAGPTQVLPARDRSTGFGARLIYNNGIEVTHQGPTGVMFTGTTGWLFVSRDKLSASDERIISQPLPPDAVRLPAPKDHRDDWIENIKSRGRCICDVEVGARSVACCHLLNLAYWHQKVLRWNPSSWEFMGEDAGNMSLMDVSRRAGYELPPI
ncbi:MAG: Gfo/Idh/MocA family oxidoreductase [Phycisphaeraceae bacterium]|nr:Gfo/Idh/MocA family oxidoreductase [Phycisphaeraceae bacterium]